jgi:hypothetical protein
MVKELFIRLHVALLAAVADLHPRPRASRAAELIEVAMYAAIVVAIAGFFWTKLSAPIQAMLDKIGTGLSR